MIFANLAVQHYKQTGSDVYGQPILTLRGTVMVAPVKLNFTSQHSTVRTDSSGSHGHADEITANVVVLALPSASIQIGDMLVIHQNKVRVTGSHARYRVGGPLDHYQVECVAWV